MLYRHLSTGRPSLSLPSYRCVLRRHLSTCRPSLSLPSYRCAGLAIETDRGTNMAGNQEHATETAARLARAAAEGSTMASCQAASSPTTRPTYQTGTAPASSRT